MITSPQVYNLKNYIEKNNFTGWDPYDALNSPIVSLLSLHTKYGKILWTQFMRRFPINFRPILLTKKSLNPKGVGLFLTSYVKLYKINPNDKDLKIINNLIHSLEKLSSTNYPGCSWGYNFDWQSRAAFVPKFTPTIVNSAFIGHALLDAYELLNNETALEIASQIKIFILNSLNRKHEGESFCFSYTPTDHNYVHNANMLGASLLIRLAALENDGSLIEPAINSMAYSINHQHEDGSWFYAETDFQSWVDSFHTAFNLMALKYFIKYRSNTEYIDPYKKGLDYYVNNFFLKDGTPKYYHNKTYPIDIHSPAAAIWCLSSEKQHWPLADKILNWMNKNMLDKKGYYYFRKNKKYINKIPYMRWTQAWALLALSNYHYAHQKERE